jgi:exodeoxyribonuclease V alpha subunit
MSISEQVSQYVNAGVVEPKDISAVALLARMAGVEDTLHPLAWVACALVARAGRDGNICLELADIAAQKPITMAKAVWPETSEWLVALTNAGELVHNTSHQPPTVRAPFVLDGTRLYIARSYHEELHTAAALLLNNASHVFVVLGGPGTGKTTYVATELIKKFAVADGEHVSLALAAPTGKAARRMRQALTNALQQSQASPDVQKQILDASSAQTVHRLLGYSQYRTPSFAFNADNPLPFSLVIIDEASMLSLSMMHHLLQAVSPGTELWLVGDPDQLASVDAGTVLGDISSAISAGATALVSRHKHLEEQHRYPEDSRINRLVKAVRDVGTNASTTDITKILSETSPDVVYIDPAAHKEHLQQVIADTIAVATSIAHHAESGNVEQALQGLTSWQVLCAHREGSMGVRGWNNIVMAGIPNSRGHDFYIGRPVMVTRNNNALDLANGDVGVVCRVNGKTMVAFDDFAGPKLVAPTRLPDLETVHALTIHKSQGSEYDHAIVVLPTVASRILTRELLYTGISRPRKKLTLIATPESLMQALQNPIRRATGLSHRL